MRYDVKKIREEIKAAELVQKARKGVLTTSPFEGRILKIQDYEWADIITERAKVQHEVAYAKYPLTRLYMIRAQMRGKVHMQKMTLEQQEVALGVRVSSPIPPGTYEINRNSFGAPVGKPVSALLAYELPDLPQPSEEQRVDQEAAPGHS